MKNITERELLKIARNIKFLILDVDGVLTDGSIILDNKGNEFKSFHVRDGHGIKMLMRAGLKVALITGRYSKVVDRRAHELGITEVFQKCRDKRIAYSQLAEKYSLKDNEIAYIGDDIVDIPLLKKAGLSVAVADAGEEVKTFAKMVTKNGGGRGAVREVCDFILKAKGLWQDIINGYSKT
ncbi:MAG: 3-deoxy-manno-octulosonate-8-phosphatase KdsC [Nitrospirota bacterium]|nr:3-deoxy-manno-octulosonate-8-phosphatase KdsC [Nitrospirota bacterium]